MSAFGDAERSVNDEGESKIEEFDVHEDTPDDEDVDDALNKILKDTADAYASAAAGVIGHDTPPHEEDEEEDKFMKAIRERMSQMEEKERELEKADADDKTNDFLVEIKSKDQSEAPSKATAALLADSEGVPLAGGATPSAFDAGDDADKTTDGDGVSAIDIDTALALQAESDAVIEDGALGDETI